MKKLNLLYSAEGGAMEGSHPVDVHVGSKLRARRLLLGLSQQEMARGVKLTFQQVQKYERGTNRVSASRLYEFAKILGVSVAYFFEGFKDSKSSATKLAEVYAIPGLAEERASFEHEALSNREMLELVRAYGKINDGAMRKRVLDLVRSMADQARTDLTGSDAKKKARKKKKQ